MQPTLKITIGAAQAMKVEVLNGQGSGCVQITDPLKAHGTVTHFEPKPEFHTQTQTTMGVTVAPDTAC